MRGTFKIWKLRMYSSSNENKTLRMIFFNCTKKSKPS